MVMTYRFTLYVFLACVSFALLVTDLPRCFAASWEESPNVTILCYMNGDNDLAEEVLHALDMIEMVGSSKNVRVIALVDGHEKWLGPYASQWAGTRLLYVEPDPRLGVISSTVLEEWCEANLGDPETLERFIRTALARYPADRYFFYTFAHSQGIIDTRRFILPETSGVKHLSISRDRTSNTNMSLMAFEAAIKRGLNGNRFELMVLFSCLANMVEVGYALSDVTDYLVGSEDEIRLVNLPPGRYQIRGLPFEKMIETVKLVPAVDTRQLGRMLVDAHVEDYERDVVITPEKGQREVCRFAAGMALVNCKALPSLVQRLDHLARTLIEHSDDPDALASMKNALSKTQQFASFLNLEYYDLDGFIRHLRGQLRQRELILACDEVLNHLVSKVILYERHTGECNATGLSIYLSNPLVPDNIYLAHHAMYGGTRFSRDTKWDEMIDIYRKRIKR